VFHKVLIANRGEVALRIIRACHELGIRTVAIYSSADEYSPHVKFADESVCIGPPPARLSYLNIPAVISAAEITGADAVHPGWGFLSENPVFAEVCRRTGITFIGPSGAAMRLLGHKVRSRAALSKHGIPILPGTGVVSLAEEALAFAEEVGFPLIIKAAAGGGGRGMKIVREGDDVGRALHTARAESEAAFANGDVYLERYLERPRHIEFQILADEHGNAVHLWERECSIQRRYQKVIEEAPSVALSDEQRRTVGALAAAAAGALGYSSAGTMEFLMDPDQGQLYFMEMNTRLQVEHPVTEWITGLDLVAEQLHIAAGKPLSFGQDDIRLEGHAIEARVNAEDPDSFRPSPGEITGYHVPGGPGIRVDSTVYGGYTVPSHYDSMVAKLIAYGKDRAQALARLRCALDEFLVEGISTNIPFLKRILDDPRFAAGDLDTHFLEGLPPRAGSSAGTGPT
jgi:acetyl-CoA carboxylase biotin carboxylase subunit